MLCTNITTATTTSVWTGRVRRVLIQVNAALTGTITINDGTGGTAKGVITNPTVGLQFEYWGLAVGVSIITSATCDISVSVDMY